MNRHEIQEGMLRYFTAEELLDELVNVMSDDMAYDLFDDIKRKWDLPSVAGLDYEDEDEEW